MKKVLVTMIVLALASVTFWYSTTLNNEVAGDITIIVIDEAGAEVVHDTFSFAQEDTLFEILDQHYEIGCANHAYDLTSECNESLTGRVILQIEDVVTDWDNTFIAIYINDEYAQFGVDMVSMHDQDIYRFEYTEVGDRE
jgi:hypothetical protein